MATQDSANDVIRTADGVPLKKKLRRANRNRRVRAVGLVLPLFAFVIVFFLIPIADMLWIGVDNPLVADNLPRTSAAFKKWDGKGLPEESFYKVFAAELKAIDPEKVGIVASRLNYERGGMLSLFRRTVRGIKRVETGPWKAAFIKIDERWKDREVLAVIKRLSSRLTSVNYLAALDLRRNADSEILFQPEERQIHITLFVRTLWVSLVIAVICLVLGYPIAHLLAVLPLRTSNLLMIMVLLPFWTSLLVRTTSWIVMLQKNGVVNDTLVWLGLISDGSRLTLIHNMTGTIVAMTHILLPFMILPLYSVMKTIPPTYVRAAKSLGATPVHAFAKIYFPLTVPGNGAGSLLVFILSVGYYITRELVGGRTGILISSIIANHMQVTNNWGLAAALGGILLGGTLALFIIFNRIVGMDKMKLG